MQALIRLFIEIALHRKGPQDVPASSAVFGLALLAYLVVGAAVIWPAADSAIVLAGQLLLDLLLVAVIFGGLLAVTGRAARTMQTLAALFGTGALLSTAALPFVWINARVFSDGAPVPGMELAAVLSTTALFMLLIASLLVTGHVMRHALGWSYAAGVLVATLYFGLSVFVFRLFFPVS